MKTVVFVCTGNTCRSPMAEGIFRVLLHENGIENVECTSRGLYVGFEMPATGHAMSAAKSYGADISGHRAKQFSEDMLERGDLFVCMTKGHMRELMKSYNVPKEKIRVLDIDDPFGGNEIEYEECAAEIHTALIKLLKDEFLFTDK